MNKSEFVAAVATEAGISVNAAEKALKAGTNIIAKELKKGEKVQITGFGTFEAPEKEAHEAYNPAKGTKVNVEAKRYPKFKAGKTLKDSVN